MRDTQRALTVLVAALTVLALAGCSSSKNETTSSGGQSGGGVTVTTAASGGPTVVTVVGGEKPDGKYYLTATPGSVTAGKATITFKNVGTKVHEVVVLTDTPADKLKVGANHEVSEDASVGEDSETDPGKTKSTTINLPPGNYVMVCNIERHYEKGMYAAFTVS